MGQLANIKKSHTMGDLFSFLKKANLRYVDKRNKGGSLWIICTHEEMDLINLEFGDLNIYFAYAKNGGKATGRRPGCYSKPRKDKGYSGFNYPITKYGQTENELMRFLEENHFEYVDKRPNNGSLWIICSPQVASALNAWFKSSGMRFAYTSRGGKATGGRAACYSTPVSAQAAPVVPQEPEEIFLPQAATTEPIALPGAETVEIPLEPVKPVEAEPVEIPVKPVEPVRKPEHQTVPPAAAQGSGCLVALVACVAVLALICLI